MNDDENEDSATPTGNRTLTAGLIASLGDTPNLTGAGGPNQVYFW